jgi:hypothetical protein
LAKNDLVNASINFRNAVQLARQVKTEQDRDTAKRAFVPALLGQVLILLMDTSSPCISSRCMCLSLFVSVYRRMWHFKRVNINKHMNYM